MPLWCARNLRMFPLAEPGPSEALTKLDLKHQDLNGTREVQIPRVWGVFKRVPKGWWGPERDVGPGLVTGGEIARRLHLQSWLQLRPWSTLTLNVGARKGQEKCRSPRFMGLLKGAQRAVRSSKSFGSRSLQCGRNCRTFVLVGLCSAERSGDRDLECQNMKGAREA